VSQTKRYYDEPSEILLETTHKGRVAGSSPAGPTNGYLRGYAHPS